jgi:hypothetical protein
MGGAKSPPQLGNKSRTTKRRIMAQPYLASAILDNPGQAVGAGDALLRPPARFLVEVQAILGVGVFALGFAALGWVVERNVSTALLCRL